jgi:replicative DNA helicase Mcm
MVVEKSVKDLFRLILPLSRERKERLLLLKPYLSIEDYSYTSYLFKRKIIGISTQTLNLNSNFGLRINYPQINVGVPDTKLQATITTWNERIKKQAGVASYTSFKDKAAQLIPALIAPHIIGMEEAKLVSSWQLFCPERFHVLLLGDPGTGKTEILRGAAQFSPISSFGLGSGTSGAGLAGAQKGSEFIKGLLPLAHKGMCCIDELNLMKPRDRGALLNAMEKGFVTYDKGTAHKNIPAEVRVLATANPKGDRFVGDTLDFLKEQMPFDAALLSRFHIVFFIRRPSKTEFTQITKHIITKKQEPINTTDVEFIKEYVTYASSIDVAFDKNLEPMVTSFFDDLKAHEKNYLIELSPRLVLGVVRMAKARARMELRTKVNHEDVKEVLETFRRSLIISPDEIAGERRRKTRT